MGAGRLDSFRNGRGGLGLDPGHAAFRSETENHGVWGEEWFGGEAKVVAKVKASANSAATLIKTYYVRSREATAGPNM